MYIVFALRLQVHGKAVILLFLLNSHLQSHNKALIGTSLVCDLMNFLCVNLNRHTNDVTCHF